MMNYSFVIDIESPFEPAM